MSVKHKDRGSLTEIGEETRHCSYCGNDHSQYEADKCLGMLPGVKYACCGHGNKEESYIIFNNGFKIKGFEVER